MGSSYAVQDFLWGLERNQVLLYLNPPSSNASFRPGPLGNTKYPSTLKLHQTRIRSHFCFWTFMVTPTTLLNTVSVWFQALLWRHL